MSDDGSILVGIQYIGGKEGEALEEQIDITNKHFFDLKEYKATLENLIETIKQYGNPSKGT